MAFPSAGTPVQTQFASSVTSMPVNMPATVNSGDLLIALVEVRNATTYTKPSGWSDISTLAQTGGGGGVGKLNGFYKIAAGTEAGTTPTWTAGTGTTGIWQTIRVTSWHGTTPPEATTTSGDSSAANPPSLTPSWGADDDLWLAIAGHAAASAAAWSAGPSSYSGFQNNGASSGGSAVSIASATRQLNATSEDPGAFTVSGSNRFWAAATIAVRPAAGGGDLSVSVSDTATTSESIKMMVESNRSVSDTATTSESISVAIVTPPLAVSVSDTVTTSESVPTPAVSYGVNVTPGPAYTIQGVKIV